MKSKSKRNKTKKNLKVLEGGSKEDSPVMPFAPGKKSIYYMLVIVTFFLLAQVLIGWVWRHFSQRGIDVVWVEEGSIVKSFPVEGMVTYEEEIITAPSPGYVYFQADMGKRVPVGKELAVLSGFPAEEEKVQADAETSEDIEKPGYIKSQFERFKRWFLYGEEDIAEEDVEENLSNELQDEDDEILSPGLELTIEAPKAGIVLNVIDGWERYGPQKEFPYLEKGEFKEIEEGKERLKKEFDRGERVHTRDPLLKIVNNYRWYFSALVPAQYGELLSKGASIKLSFSFAPGTEVAGEVIELNQRENGDYEVTWQITREVEDYYSYRWSSAEIIYEIIEGKKIPEESYIEQDGREGIFIVDRGKVRFQEVEVMGEKEDHILIEELDYTNAVITTPNKVEEGQHIN